MWESIFTDLVLRIKSFGKRRRQAVEISEDMLEWRMN